MSEHVKGYLLSTRDVVMKGLTDLPLSRPPRLPVHSPPRNPDRSGNILLQPISRSLQSSSPSTSSLQSTLPSHIMSAQNIPRVISELTPIITITPATLPFHLDLPPTPLSLMHDRPLFPLKPLESGQAQQTHAKAITRAPPTPGWELDHSLQIPLMRHLQFLHPNTPKEVIQFVTTRLLSTDKPYGHQGIWTPISGCDDLSAAGVGKDAGKGYFPRHDGEGKNLDQRMQAMYEAARESWRRLDDFAPTGGRV